MLFYDAEHIYVVLDRTLVSNNGAGEGRKTKNGETSAIMQMHGKPKASLGSEDPWLPLGKVSWRGHQTDLEVLSLIAENPTSPKSPWEGTFTSPLRFLY